MQPKRDDTNYRRVHVENYLEYSEKKPRLYHHK